MNKTALERSLHVLQAQVHMEMAEAAADVAQAALQSLRMTRMVATARRHNEIGAMQLRALMARTSLDPALLHATRSVCDEAARVLNERLAAAATASRREDLARTALSQVRYRDRSLEAAKLDAYRRRQHQERLKEYGRIDDLWLQSSGRTKP